MGETGRQTGEGAQRALCWRKGITRLVESPVFSGWQLSPSSVASEPWDVFRPLIGRRMYSAVCCFTERTLLGTHPSPSLR